ncbi:hypothetical protein LROSL1_2321 [Furfurilactobacillus rossiae]|nr:hypothetical protein LROSL1_2321 [Furfurilactobacillus rossiae]
MSINSAALSNKCIHQFVETLVSTDDVLSLSDGSHDERRQLFLDSYPSVVIVLSTYLQLHDDERVRDALKVYVRKEIEVLKMQKKNEYIAMLRSNGCGVFIKVG